MFYFRKRLFKAVKYSIILQEWMKNKQAKMRWVKDEQLNWIMEQKGSMATQGWKDSGQQRK